MRTIDVAGAVGVAAAAVEEWSRASLSRRAKVLFAVREPATLRTRATVVAERRPAASAGSTAGYHVTTSI